MDHTERFRTWRAPVVKQFMPFGPNASDTLSPDQHCALVSHLMRLLYSAEERRYERNQCMAAIETDLLGAVEPTGGDCERKEARIRGKDVSVPDAIYPFGWLSLQKFAAEICELVMPVEAPYNVVASAGKQEVANQLIKALQHQATQFDHRNNIHAAIFDTIALDLGAGYYDWESLTGGAKASDPLSSQDSPGEGTSISGPVVVQLDPYNVSYDPHTPEEDLVRRGQFFARFDLISPFELERLEGGQNFLPEDVQEKVTCAAREYGGPNFAYGMPGESSPYGNWFYYQPEIASNRAKVLAEWGSNRKQPQTNFSGIFSQHQLSGLYHDRSAIHRTVMYVRLKPSKWGLGPKLRGQAAKREAHQVWEIHIVGEGYICYARPCVFAQDRMPCFVATMNFRRKFGRSFRYGDHAAQLGLYASTIMNMHKRALRKGIDGGLTVFNAKVFNLNDLETAGHGRVPARMQNFDDDIRRHIAQYADLPDTKNNMNDVGALMNMLSDFFPANSRPEMMGMDRATQYQAQAVMVTGIRALMTYAALADGQIMSPTRYATHHLNLLYVDELTFIDTAKREKIKMQTTDIQQAEFELVQSQPMMGIDRLRAGNMLRDVVNILFQSGGQISPIQAFMLERLIQIEGIPLSMEEMEEAMRAQAEFEAQQAAAEAAAQGGGGATGAPAAAQGAPNRAMAQ